jgi:hypothetical protein
MTEQPPDRGVADALRSAIERTLEATEGRAVGTRERAGELLDEVARRGRDARDELARRGQEAGAGVARRGQATRDEVGRQLEALEKRLASIEELLRRRTGGGAETESKPKAED